MKAIIAEDEGVAARRLKKMIEANGFEVIDTFNSNEKLLSYLDQNAEPDLFFLDIHLSDGIIFEVLQEREISTPIIFTTAYDEYAIKAFKQNSIDYLLKPIKDTELSAAIEKFKKIYKAKPSLNLQEISAAILQASTVQQTYRERIRIKIGDRIKSIPIHEVTHLYSEQKINFLHTNEGRSYPIDYTIVNIMKELDPRNFYRVSRSQIVNINAIKDVLSYSNSRLKIIIETKETYEIVVARERVKDFKMWLG